MGQHGLPRDLADDLHRELLARFLRTGDECALSDLQAGFRPRLRKFFAAFSRVTKPKPFPTHDLIELTFSQIRLARKAGVPLRASETVADWVSNRARDALDGYLMLLYYAGNAEAFGEVAKYWHPALVKRFHKKTGRRYSDDRAWDYAGGVLLRVCETRNRRSRFDPSVKPFSVWLRVVADNYRKDFLKKETRNSRTDEESSDEPPKPSIEVELSDDLPNAEPSVVQRAYTSWFVSLMLRVPLFRAIMVGFKPNDLAGPGGRGAIDTRLFHKRREFIDRNEPFDPNEP